MNHKDNTIIVQDFLNKVKVSLQLSTAHLYVFIILNC